MKKILRILLCTVTLISLFLICSSAVEAKKLTYGDFEYSILKDGTVQIEKYTATINIDKYDGSNPEIFHVVVPSEIDGKKVTSIGKKAFHNLKYMETAEVPSTVKTIGAYAFADSDFHTVTLNEGLETIGKYAFYNTNVASLKVPTTVKSLGAYFFGYERPSGKDSKPQYLHGNVGRLYCAEKSVGETYAVKNKISYEYFKGDYGYIILSDGTVEIKDYNGSAKNLTVPKKIAGKKVTKIGIYAFAYNGTLKKVTIPGNIKTVSKAAFFYINTLQKVTIEDGVKTLKDYAFKYCRNLTDVTMADSVTKLGNYVFEDCHSLENISFSKNLTSIGSDILIDTKFRKNKENWQDNILYANTYALDSDIVNLKGKVKIKDGVTVIAARAFSPSSKYYNNITEVIIPDSVKIIGREAFNNCRALKKVTIPKSVKTIGNDAFNGCENLSELTLKNGIETIGKRAFYNTDLKNITVPKSVKSIGEKAFGYITNYKSREAKFTDFLIKGYKGSKAEAYAKNNGFEFNVKK